MLIISGPNWESPSDVRQAHRQEVGLALDPADDAQRFAKIHLGMARRMCEGHKHLPLSLAGAADVVLHNRNPAREAMLVTKAFEDPLRRVTLLLRTVLILREDLLDDTGERVELGPDQRPAEASGSCDPS